MASLAITLKEFADNGNSRTYSLSADGTIVTSGHTLSQPKLVLQKRKVPENSQTMSETTVSVVYGTEDSNGDALPQKINLAAQLRYPKDSIAADLTEALAVFRDVVASDEFGDAFTTQNWME